MALSDLKMTQNGHLDFSQSNFGFQTLFGTFIFTEDSNSNFGFQTLNLIFSCTIQKIYLLGKIVRFEDDAKRPS